MGRGFKNLDMSSRDALIILAGLIAFFLIIFALAYILNNKTTLWGRLQYLGRLLEGKGRTPKRVKRFSEVVLQVRFGPDPTYRTQIQNLSSGGMFVKMNPPLELGERFRFLLNLNKNDSVTGDAEVVWIQHKWSPHHPSGIGCKFLNLTDTDKNLIRAYLKRK